MSRVYIDRMYEQLARDYSCDAKDLKSTENVFTKKILMDGRRTFKEDDYLVKVLSINGKAVFCIDEMIYDEVCDKFKDASGAWFNIYTSLKELDEVVAKYGYGVTDQHHFYLPTGAKYFSDEEFEALTANMDFAWYEKEDIKQFSDDGRFHNAFSYVDTAPDMLGVAALIDGKIAGMSGVSADSEYLWQVGIDVLPEYRGRNIGPILTTLIKEEVLKRGKVPFYGTAESHIQSQKVAIKSGFMPMWWEAITSRVKEH